MNIKCLNGLKRTAALILCVIVAACGVFAASAQTFTITELDDMAVTLPDNVSAITRESKSTDKYFSEFGLDYNTTMQTFKNSDIYLQGMDSGSTVTYTVTMTKTDESEKIGNYNQLSADEMTQVRNKFLNMGEYGTCTPDQSEKLVWLIFDVTVSSGGKQIKAYQANTVYEGMSVNITLKRNEGDVTADDYSVFSQVVSSVDFLRADFTSNILPYVILGGAVVIILLIVLIVVLARRAKKRRKRHKNNAILEELASKYNLNDKNSGYSLDSFDESPKIQDEPEPDGDDEIPVPGSDYYEDKADRYASDDEIDDIINTAKAYKKGAAVIASQEENAPEEKEAEAENETEAEAENETENETENEAESRKDEAFSHYEDISSESKPEVEPEQDNSGKIPEESAENDNEKYSERDYTERLFGSDVSSDDDNESDEVLVRQQARRTKFDSGYDFFEEAPKKTMGVLSSEEIRDAEDYDVINEVEQKAQRVKSEGKAGPNSAVVFLKKAGGGIKSFCIHFGYFCKNVSIMIKRKRAASKRKKAEQERRERARQRAERERLRAQRQHDGSDNGLVRVHTKNGAGGSRSQGSNSRGRRR